MIRTGNIPSWKLIGNIFDRRIHNMKCLGFHLNSNNLRLSPCGNLQLVTVKAQSFVHSDLVEKKEPRIDPCNKVVVATISAQRVGFFNIGSGRVGYWKKYRVAGRVRVG